MKKWILLILAPLLFAVGIDKSKPENNIKYGKFALEQYCNANNEKLSPIGGLVDTNVFEVIKNSLTDMDKAIKDTAINILNATYDASQYYTSDTFLTILILNSLINSSAHLMCSNENYRKIVTQDYILSTVNDIIEKNLKSISKNSFNREIAYKDSKYGVPYVVKIDDLIRIVPAISKTGQFKTKKLNTPNIFAQKQLNEFIDTFSKSNESSLQKVCENIVKEKLTQFVGNVLTKLSTSYKIYLKNKNKCITWKNKYGKIGNLDINNAMYSDDLFNQTIGVIFNTGYDILNKIDDFQTKVSNYIANTIEAKESIVNNVYNEYFSYLNDDYITSFFKTYFEKSDKVNFYFYLKKLETSKREYFYKNLKNYLLVFFATPYYYTYHGIAGIKLIDDIKDLKEEQAIIIFAKDRYKQLIDLQNYLVKRIEKFLSKYVDENKFIDNNKVILYIEDNKVKLKTASQILNNDLFNCNNKYLTNFQQKICLAQTKYLEYFLKNLGSLSNYEEILILKSIVYTKSKNFIFLPDK